MAYKYQYNPGIQDNVSLRSHKTHPHAAQHKSSLSSSSNRHSPNGNGTLTRYEVR